MAKQEQRREKIIRKKKIRGKKEKNHIFEIFRLFYYTLCPFLGTELCDGQQPGEGAGGQVLPAGVRGAEQVLDVHASIDLLQSDREKLLLLLLLLLLLIKNFERGIKIRTLKLKLNMFLFPLLIIISIQDT